VAADLPSLIRSHARGRFVFLGLAVVAPLLLLGLLRRKANVDAETESVIHKTMLGLFVFFAANAAMSHAKLGVLRRRAQEAGMPSASLAGENVISPVWLGRIVAAVLLAVLVSVNHDDAVRAVQEKAFGASPLGLGTTLFADLATVVLFAPYFWVMEHAMRIVVQARQDGTWLSRSGLLSYLLEVGKRHPELARSRNVVAFGLGYFFLLLGLWIAYAEARGI
jgi:hypothetical protein